MTSSRCEKKAVFGHNAYGPKNQTIKCSRLGLYRWTEIKLFVQVAENGSLSRAAETLDLSNAAASRHLSALQGRLGARLVKRNTRRIYLNDTGKVVAGVAGVAHAVTAPPRRADRMPPRFVCDSG